MLGVAFTFALVGLRPPVSLSILNYATNQWPPELAAQMGAPTYVVVRIATTNNSSQPLEYLAMGSIEFVDYEVLSETPEGWKAPGGFKCGTGLVLHTLRPRQGLIFEAAVPTTNRCRIQFSYSRGRSANPLWRRLPLWLRDKLPWLAPWRDALTEPIDLRSQS